MRITVVMNIQFQLFTVVKAWTVVIWIMISCGLVGLRGNWFGGTYCLLLWQWKCEASMCIGHRNEGSQWEWAKQEISWKGQISKATKRALSRKDFLYPWSIQGPSLELALFRGSLSLTIPMVTSLNVGNHLQDYTKSQDNWEMGSFCVWSQCEQKCASYKWNDVVTKLCLDIRDSGVLCSRELLQRSDF